MKNHGWRLYGLSAVTVVLALASSVEALQTPDWDFSTKPQLDSYWGDPTLPAVTWHSSAVIASPEETRGFCRFEARGTSAHDDGVWVMLLTRVTMNPSYLNVESMEDYQHSSFTVPESTAIGGSHQDAIISSTRFEALIDTLKVQDANDFYYRIPERLQPMVPSADACTWDADYAHWPASATRAMWQSYRVPQTGQVFNLEAMITRTITDQTGGAINGEDMFYDVGAEAMQDHDLQLEVQAIFMHADSDSDFYNPTPPTGPQGTYIAVGTSTPVQYKFFDSTDELTGKIYPTLANYMPLVGMSTVQAGQSFPIYATFVTKPSQATVLLDSPGFPPTTLKFTVFKFPGQPLSVYVPPWIPAGTLGEVVQLHTPFDDLATIPAAHRDGFSVY